MTYEQEQAEKIYIRRAIEAGKVTHAKLAARCSLTPADLDQILSRDFSFPAEQYEVLRKVIDDPDSETLVPHSL